MAACTVNLTKLRKVWEEHYNEDEFPVENLIVRSKDTFALVENKQTDD